MTAKKVVNKTQVSEEENFDKVMKRITGFVEFKKELRKLKKTLGKPVDLTKPPKGEPIILFDEYE